MDTAITVALISLVGSLCGTFGGIFVSSKLTIYRIEQLEKKMDKFVDLESQINKLELHNAVQDERTDHIEKAVEKLEERYAN